MLKRRNLALLLTLTLLPLLFPRTAAALRPMSHFIELVAGEGDQELVDGEYWRAAFNQPLGVSSDPTGTRLCVADAGNHVLRLINLADKNRVTTLAGTGRKGFEDGTLAHATFNTPRAVVWIDNYRILVRDEGNQAFRMVDLQTGRVTTLGGAAGKVPRPYQDLTQDAVWNMAYLRSARAVFFTQPSIGALKKIDLATGAVSLVVQGNPLVPFPNALCAFKGNLWVGDRDGENVCRVQAVDGASVTLLPEGKAKAPAALVGLADEIVALMPGWDTWSRAYPAGDYKLMTAWGFPVGEDPSHFTGLVYAIPGQPLGLCPSPTEGHRFFVALPALNRILSIREHHQDQLKDLHSNPASGLNDYDYPTAKPKGTFRIMIIGNSYSYSLGFNDLHRWGDKVGMMRSENMPKKLELFLNTEAAWRDCPTRFEVMHYGFPGDQPLFLWPTYLVPDMVKKFDVDLVLEFVAPETFNTSQVFFQRPMTPEGYPAQNTETDYLMKPWDQKIPGGKPKAYFEYLKSKNLAQVSASGQILLEGFDRVLEDEKAREMVVDLFTPSIRAFTRKLSSLRTSGGQPVQYRMFFLPIRNKGNSSHRVYSAFWKRIANGADFPFQDLTQPFVTFSSSYWPADETEGGMHFLTKGHDLLAYILTHTLVESGLVKLDKPKPAP